MKMKKWICVLLVLCMVMAFLPVTAGAAATGSGSCGTGVNWTLENGVLKISGTGAMQNFSNSPYGSAPWYTYRNDIKEVVISKGVTTVGNNAFYNCVNLTKVTLGESVERIGMHSFSACVKLTQITLPKNLKQIEGGAFAATGLTTIRIPAAVTQVDPVAFMNCSSLQSITVESQNANYSSDGKVLFNKDKSRLVLCPQGFSGSYTVPAGVKTIGENAFDNCQGLTSITIPSSVKTIEKFAFGLCESLATVTLSEGLVTIGQEAFSGCEKLVSLKIPASVSFIESSAFSWCRGLKDLWFQDDAPSLGRYIFSSVSAKVHYPSNYASWTAEIRQSYGGNVTWVPYTATVVKHTYDNGKTTTAPTCTNTGVKTYTCKDCGKIKVETVKALGHDFKDVNPVFDLTTKTHSWDCTRCDYVKKEACKFVDKVIEEATLDSYGLKEYTCSVCAGSFQAHYLYRISGAHRFETAVRVADEMKGNLGVEKFDAIIIASGNDFADALAGSYLSTVKNAPILLAWGRGGNYEYLDTNNIDYIKANLAEGGTVYILGGTNAVPELYETSLEGYTVKRLGGANRFETNLLILAEAGVKEGDEILVCTSTNFADSLSASATGKPILLVFNEFGALYGGQPDFLAGLTGNTFCVIGGENAVSTALEQAVAAYGTTTRLAGENRFQTSVMVAEKYFEAPESAVLAYAWNYPDGLCGGSLAFSMDAPLILTMTNYEAQATEYIQAQGIEKGIVLGGTGLISDDAVRCIFAMSEDNIVAAK